MSANDRAKNGKKIKWSEFKKLVDQTTKDTDPEIAFILFDVDYDPAKLYVAIAKDGKLMVEG